MSVAGASERGVRTRRRILPAGSTWRSPLAIVGMAIAGAWIVIAHRRAAAGAERPARAGLPAAEGAGPGSTCSAPTSSAATC